MFFVKMTLQMNLLVLKLLLHVLHMSKWITVWYSYHRNDRLWINI